MNKTLAHLSSAAKNILLRVIYLSSKGIFINARLLEGRIAGTEQDFRLLTLGNTPFLMDLVQRTFGANQTVSRSWRVSLFELPALLDKRGAAFDLAVSELPGTYDIILSRKATFRSRQWVRQIVDLSGGWDKAYENFSASRRTASNRITRRSEFGCRTSKREADFEVFYHRMLVPYIKNRYEEFAEFDSYSSCKKMFENGFLLFIVEDGKDIAGCISSVSADRWQYMRVGVLDGDEALMRTGCLAAIYHHQLRLAADQGLLFFDARFSRPYLNDGVYCHKSEWGARAEYPGSAGFQDDTVNFYCPDISAPLCRMLERNPLVVMTEEGKLEAVAGSSGSNNMPGQGLPPALLKLHLAGLTGVTVVS